MKRKYVKKRGSRVSIPDVSLTPLIDTALTLLVIFMITAPMVRYGIKVNLPHGTSQQVSDLQELAVTIDPEGKLYVNNRSIDKQDLARTVHAELAGQRDVPVYVRADRSISYGLVIEVVDILKRSGVHLVAMSTQNKIK